LPPIYIFNYRTCPQGHGPTNVTRWLEEKNGCSKNKEEDDKSYYNSIKYVNRFEEPYYSIFWATGTYSPSSIPRTLLASFSWIWK
jgi:hypothetical protein